MEALIQNPTLNPNPNRLEFKKMTVLLKVKTKTIQVRKTKK